MTIENEHPGKDDAFARLRRQLETESADGLKLLADVENNPICSIAFDPALPGIVVVWKRYATSNQLRFIHEHILLLLERHGVSKVLGDDTALATIHDDDERWIVQDWMPRAVAAGFKAGASKRSASFFGRLSIETVRSAAPTPLTIRVFDDLPAARQWLQDFR